MEQNKFSFNDFVWAKLQGYPPWPALVIEPDDLAVSEFNKKGENKRDYYWVYFLGTQDYSWVKETAVKPYGEFREKFVSLYKKLSFKQAVEEMDRYVELRKEDPDFVVEDIAEYRGRVAKRPRSRADTSSPGPLETKRRRRSSSATSAESSITSSSHRSISSKITMEPSSWCTMLNTKNIRASHKWIGVIGLGFIGRHIVRNLIRSGHRVNIWNRTVTKREQLETELEDAVGKTLNGFSNIQKLLKKSNIIFVCISGEGNSKHFIQENFGVNDANNKILEGKSIVLITAIDPETSKNIRDMVEEKGARYLETQIQWGNAGEALEDSIMLFAAGNRSLFDACQSCFKAISRHAIFLGKTGYASIITLIFQLIRGVCLAGLSESLCLVKRLGVEEKEIIEILNYGDMNSEFLVYKMMKILSGQFADVDQSLVNMQMDMKMGLDLSNMAGQPMNITAVAHEIFKHCRRLDYGKMDASVIYKRNMH